MAVERLLEPGDDVVLGNTRQRALVIENFPAWVKAQALVAFGTPVRKRQFHLEFPVEDIEKGQLDFLPVRRRYGKRFEKTFLELSQDKIDGSRCISR